MRTSIRPTPKLFAIAGGAVLLFAVGTNVQAGWVLVVAALLLGILIAGVILPLRSTHGIEVARIVPPVATAGQRVPVSLRISNRSNRVRGLFRVSDRFLGPGWAVVSTVPSGSTATYADRRAEVRRGTYESGTATIESGAPFGIVRLSRTIEIPSPIVVYPKVYEVASSVVGRAGGWHAPAAVGDVSSVRDYKPGDPLRHIHWRSVARRGKLMVREFDHERRAEVSVAAAVGDDADVADAVATIASSLAIGALRSGEVDLVSAAASSRARSVDAVLDWGARLSPGAISLEQIVATASPSGGLIVVCPAATAGLERLGELTQDASVLAVLVGERAPAAQYLRSAGASVAEIAVGEVEAWFANGCAAA